MSSPSRFEVREIPNTCAFDLNGRGQVVGVRGSTAVIWEDGEFRSLVDFVNTDDHCYAPRRINDRGQVLLLESISEMRDGRRTHLQSTSHLWWEGELTELGPWQGWDLNQAGQVVFRRGQDGDTTTHIWESGKEWQVGPQGFEGEVLSDCGHVAGALYVDEEHCIASYCHQGEIVLWDQLGPGQGFIHAINNACDFVVSHTAEGEDTDTIGIVSDGQFRAVVLDALWLTSAGINEQGFAVGAYGYRAEIPEVFQETTCYWNGQSHSLFHLTGGSHDFQSNVAINGRGQIIAHDGKASYLLTPR